MLFRRHVLAGGFANLLPLGHSTLMGAAASSPYAKRVLEKKPCGY